MLAFAPGVVPHQNGKRSVAANLPESVHGLAPLRERVILRLHEANQCVDLIPGKLAHGSLAEFVSTLLNRPGQADEAPVPSDHHDYQSDEPPCLHALDRTNTPSSGVASRFVHHWLGLVRPTASVHQRPLTIVPAAVWCNAC